MNSMSDLENYTRSSLARFAIRLVILLGIPAILGSIPLVWARMTRTTDVFSEMYCGIAAAANGVCMGVDSSFGANLVIIETGAVISGVIIAVIAIRAMRR